MTTTRATEIFATDEVRFGTVIGDRPIGRADGTERWASITDNDGTLTVTAFRGWGITDEVRLTGKNATVLAESIARQLIAS